MQPGVPSQLGALLLSELLAHLRASPRGGEASMLAPAHESAPKRQGFPWTARGRKVGVGGTVPAAVWE